MIFFEQTLHERAVFPLREEPLREHPPSDAERRLERRLRAELLLIHDALQTDARHSKRGCNTCAAPGHTPRTAGRSPRRPPCARPSASRGQDAHSTTHSGKRPSRTACASVQASARSALRNSRTPSLAPYPVPCRRKASTRCFSSFVMSIAPFKRKRTRDARFIPLYS